MCRHYARKLHDELIIPDEKMTEMINFLLLQ